MKEWLRFRKQHQNGWYQKEYRNYSYVVWQHLNMGHLCGYIALKHDDVVNTYQLDCHGGITYEGDLTWIFPDNKRTKFIGFDCNHLGDLAPFVPYVFVDTSLETWRTPEYIEEECRKLIDQIIESR